MTMRSTWLTSRASVTSRLSAGPGRADREIFPGMAEQLGHAMPDGQLSMLPGEGHLLLFTHWAAILRQLATEQLAAK